MSEQKNKHSVIHYGKAKSLQLEFVCKGCDHPGEICNDAFEYYKYFEAYGTIPAVKPKCIDHMKILEDAPAKGLRLYMHMQEQNELKQAFDLRTNNENWEKMKTFARWMIGPPATWKEWLACMVIGASISIVIRAI